MNIHIPTDEEIITVLESTAPAGDYFVSCVNEEWIGGVYLPLKNDWKIKFFKRHGEIRYISEVFIPMSHDIVVEILCWNAGGDPKKNNHELLSYWEPPQWWGIGPVQGCYDPPVRLVK